MVGRVQKCDKEWIKSGPDGTSPLLLHLTTLRTHLSFLPQSRWASSTTSSSLGNDYRKRITPSEWMSSSSIRRGAPC